MSYSLKFLVYVMWLKIHIIILYSKFLEFCASQDTNEICILQYFFLERVILLLLLGLSDVLLLKQKVDLTIPVFRQTTRRYVSTV